eukprot:4177063-Heterocapsa_arctica.AAC.1
MVGKATIGMMGETMGDGVVEVLLLHAIIGDAMKMGKTKVSRMIIGMIGEATVVKQTIDDSMGKGKTMDNKSIIGITMGRTMVGKIMVGIIGREMVKLELRH